jgi:hypothetical protein
MKRVSLSDMSKPVMNSDAKERTKVIMYKNVKLYWSEEVSGRSLKVCAMSEMYINS